LVRCAGGARELHKLNKLTRSLWTPEDLRGRYVPYAVVVFYLISRAQFKLCKKAEQVVNISKIS
jgi:hypothetical protein